jgi:hypothetical protein
MGKKKKTVTVEEELEPGAATDDEAVAELVPDDYDMPPEFDSVVEQLEGADVSKVMIHKTNKLGKSPYLTTLVIGEFDDLYQTIADRFGGGRYYAKLFGTPPGGGKPRILKGYPFYIDEAVTPQPRTAPVLAAPGPDELTKLLLDKLIDNAPRKDPMEIAAALAAASAAQMQNSIALIAPLLDKIVGGGKGMGVGEIMQAIELGASLAGDRDGDGWAPIVREGVVPLVKALEAAAARRAAPPAPAPKAVTAEAGKPPWYGMLRPYVLGIMPHIVAGMPPELVAENVWVQAESFGDWLDTAMEKLPAFPDQVLGAFPELQPHAQWVRAFLGEFGPETPPGNTVTGKPAEGPDEDVTVQ